MYIYEKKFCIPAYLCKTNIIKLAFRPHSLVFNFTSSLSPLLFRFCFSVDNMQWKPIFLLLTDSLNISCRSDFWLSCLEMEKLHETLFILFSSLQLSRLSSTHEWLCVTTDNSGKEAATHVQPQLPFLQRQSDEGRANYVRGVGGI